MYSFVFIFNFKIYLLYPKSSPNKYNKVNSIIFGILNTFITCDIVALFQINQYNFNNSI